MRTPASNVDDVIKQQVWEDRLAIEAGSSEKHRERQKDINFHEARLARELNEAHPSGLSRESVEAAWAKHRQEHVSRTAGLDERQGGIALQKLRWAEDVEMALSRLYERAPARAERLLEQRAPASTAPDAQRGDRPERVLEHAPSRPLSSLERQEIAAVAVVEMGAVVERQRQARRAGDAPAPVELPRVVLQSRAPDDVPARGEHPEAARAAPRPGEQRPEPPSPAQPRVRQTAESCLREVAALRGAQTEADRRRAGLVDKELAALKARPDLARATPEQLKRDLDRVLEEREARRSDRETSSRLHLRALALAALLAERERQTMQPAPKAPATERTQAAQPPPAGTNPGSPARPLPSHTELLERVDHKASALEDRVVRLKPAPVSQERGPTRAAEDAETLTGNPIGERTAATEQKERTDRRRGDIDVTTSMILVELRQPPPLPADAHSTERSAPGTGTTRSGERSAERSPERSPEQSPERSPERSSGTGEHAELGRDKQEQQRKAEQREPRAQPGDPSTDRIPDLAFELEEQRALEQTASPKGSFVHDRARGDDEAGADHAGDDGKVGREASSEGARDDERNDAGNGARNDAGNGARNDAGNDARNDVRHARDDAREDLDATEPLPARPTTAADREPRAAPGLETDEPDTERAPRPAVFDEVERTLRTPQRPARPAHDLEENQTEREHRRLDGRAPGSSARTRPEPSTRGVSDVFTRRRPASPEADTAPGRRRRPRPAAEVARAGARQPAQSTPEEPRAQAGRSLSNDRARAEVMHALRRDNSAPHLTRPEVQRSLAEDLRARVDPTDAVRVRQVVIAEHVSVLSQLPRAHEDRAAVHRWANELSLDPSLHTHRAMNDYFAGLLEDPRATRTEIAAAAVRLHGMLDQAVHDAEVEQRRASARVRALPKEERDERIERAAALLASGKAQGLEDAISRRELFLARETGRLRPGPHTTSVLDAAAVCGAAGLDTPSDTSIGVVGREERAVPKDVLRAVLDEAAGLPPEERRRRRWREQLTASLESEPGARARARERADAWLLVADSAR